VRREEPTAARAAAERPEPARPAPQAEIREETPEEVSRGGPRDQEHKKVLSARRRLLGMLLVLAIAAGVLAYTRMAAWWVIVPPAVMLLGYLALLYEAGKADAERRELARTRATAAATEAAAEAAAVAAAKRAAPPAPATPAPAPEAEIIDISASLTVAGHKFYDQYADAKRRAVGD
jgi:small-conductance mechanosensitive channel